MKKTKKILITILLYILFISSAYTQSLNSDYRVAIGLRAGETSGVAFKYNISDSKGFELLAGIWSNWLNLTGLYEIKAAAFNVDGMKWYYGGGGHIAFRTDSYYNEGRTYIRGDDFALGIDGVLGLEYKIAQIPFVVCFDIKPLAEVYRNGDMYFSFDPGIGVKFTF